MHALVASYADSMLLSQIEGAGGVTDHDSEWDAFVASSPGGHHAQSSAWGRVKADQGWEMIRVAITDGSDLVAGAQIASKRGPGFGRLGYIDHGPVVTERSDEALGQLIDIIDEAMRRNGIKALLVQPPADGSGLAESLIARGCSPTPLRVSVGATVLLDLSPEPDELLAGMKSGTRYNIRRSLRSELEVRVADEEGFEAFCGMLEATGQRQGFVPDLEAVRSMRRQMGEDCEVLLAVLEDRPIAGILTVRFGDRICYKRGAWSGLAGGLHPNERLQWEAMLRYRSRGVRIYDFEDIDRSVAAAFLETGKVPPEASQTLSSFKLGFGGRAVLLPDPLIRIPGRLARWAHDTIAPPLARSNSFERVIERIRH